MPTVVYVLLCLALPWLWGALVAAFYARRARGRSLAKGEKPKTDYSI